jgi:hypothetical protein
VVSSGASVAEVWIEDAHGERVSAVEQGARFSICALVDVHEPTEDPEIGITVHDENGAVAFASTSRREAGREPALTAGERVRLRVTLDNRLKRGRWHVDCGMHAGPTRVVAFRWRAGDFVVYGSRPQDGLVAIDHEVELERERVGAPPAEAAR